MNLGNAHLRGKHAAMLLVRGNELGESLRRIVALVQEIKVLRAQEAGVPQQLMILIAGNKEIGGLQAVGIVLQLVQAGGPLGGYLGHLGELPPPLHVRQGARGKLPVGLLASDQGIGVIELQIVDDGRVVKTRRRLVQAQRGFTQDLGGSLVIRLPPGMNPRPPEVCLGGNQVGPGGKGGKALFGLVEVLQLEMTAGDEKPGVLDVCPRVEKLLLPFALARLLVIGFGLGKLEVGLEVHDRQLVLLQQVPGQAQAVLAGRLLGARHAGQGGGQGGFGLVKLIKENVTFPLQVGRTRLPLGNGLQGAHLREGNGGFLDLVRLVKGKATLVKPPGSLVVVGTGSGQLRRPLDHHFPLGLLEGQVANLR